jgi:hypothetical protein
MPMQAVLARLCLNVGGKKTIKDHFPLKLWIFMDFPSSKDIKSGNPSVGRCSKSPQSRSLLASWQGAQQIHQMRLPTDFSVLMNLPL